MRGVILAGGKGTRMLPGTRVTNKQLLPLYTPQGAVPMIFYPINTLINMGIQDILIISSKEHCGPIIENLGDGSTFGADFTYKIQDTSHVPLGIASALKLAKGFTGGDDFFMILGDNFFEERFETLASDFNKDQSCAVVVTREVDDPERFGVIVDLGEGRWKIVEKPAKPESNCAVAGLYGYRLDVFDVAEEIQMSARGELEITDINQYYAERGELTVVPTSGFWSDMGVPNSLQRTQMFISRTGFSISHGPDLLFSK